MRVIALHSQYRWRGGEDESFDTETALLETRGHEVVRFVRTGAELERRAAPARVGAALWNAAAARDLSALLRSFRPDVAYVNNHFPTLGPSCLATLGAAAVPTVVAVRNYRLGCVSGRLFRDGQPCVACLTARLPAPAIVHGCYRNSRPASAVAVAAGLTARRVLDRADPPVRYAAVSEHVRRFLLTLGIPDSRIVVKPNTLRSVPDAGAPAEDYVLFVGRLEAEKGVLTAVEAARAAGQRLVVVGDGPLADRLDPGDSVSVLGARPLGDVLDAMRRARVTLVPSGWDEPFGRVAMESLACGTPVVVSERGGLAEIPEPRVSGLLVDPGDPSAVTRALRVTRTDPWWTGGARRAARERFDRCFSPGLVGRALEDILVSAAGLATAVQERG